ncbi:hypothetical protein D3C80_1758800 [compost metagenome]
MIYIKFLSAQLSIHHFPVQGNVVKSLCLSRQVKAVAVVVSENHMDWFGVIFSQQCKHKRSTDISAKNQRICMLYALQCRFKIPNIVV